MYPALRGPVAVPSGRFLHCAHDLKATTLYHAAYCVLSKL